jgi:hypothetical protein
VTVAIAVGATAFFGAAFALRVAEVREVFGLVRARFAGKGG